MQHYVLPEDVFMATKLFACCFDCLRRAEIAVQQEQLDIANSWVIEFERARKELKQLRQKKIENDKLLTLLLECTRKQIQVEALLRGIDNELYR